jgi:predicted RNA methylase
MEIKQRKGLARNTIDKFYTKTNIAKLCTDMLKKHIKINATDLIIEPSAGNGAFIGELKMVTCDHRFYDIEPENEEIIKQDFLEFDYSPDKKNYSKIHVIGNPPFGRQSSVAIKFIKKSCEFCDDCSFILPKSFRKNSLKRVFPINFHLIYEMDLPSNSFLVDGVEHDVPCIFQIWEKKDTNRLKDEKLEPINFQFIKKIGNDWVDVGKNDSSPQNMGGKGGNDSSPPDASFRRIGVNAGKLDTNIEGKSKESHYFIKFTNGKSVKENIERLSEIKYTFNNTVGPKSISKHELINYWRGIL